MESSSVFGAITIRHLRLRAKVLTPWDWFGDADSEFLRTYPDEELIVFASGPKDSKHTIEFLEQYRPQLEYDVDKWCFYEIDQHLSAYLDADYEWEKFVTDYDIKHSAEIADSISVPDKLRQVNAMSFFWCETSNFQVRDISQKTTSLFLFHKNQDEFRECVRRPSNIDEVRRLRDRVASELERLKWSYEDYSDKSNTTHPNTQSATQPHRLHDANNSTRFTNPKSMQQRTPKPFDKNDYYSSKEVADIKGIKANAVVKQCLKQKQHPDRPSVYRGCIQHSPNSEWYIPKANFHFRESENA